MASLASGLRGERNSGLLLCRETPCSSSTRLPFWVSGNVGADMVAGRPVWASSCGRPPPGPLQPPREPEGALSPASLRGPRPPVVWSGRGSGRPVSPPGSREKRRPCTPGPQGPARTARPGAGVLGQRGSPGMPSSFSFPDGSAQPGRWPVSSDRALLTQENETEHYRGGARSGLEN